MQQIKIKALDIFGKPILNIADKILLDIEYNNIITHTLSNPKEQDGGIYIFDNIPSNVSLFANVFIRLASNTLVPNTSNRYYCQTPYFLHNTCTQINKFQAMLDNAKPTPYIFDMQIQTYNIGLIKAYKKDKEGKFIDDKDSLSNSQNEIYTIDLEQEIMLKAFVYEEQKIYVAQDEVKDKNKQIKQNHALQWGNITKTIKFIDKDDAQNIKWAFKLSNYDNIALNTSLQKDEKGFIGLKQSGASIKFALKDILKDEVKVKNLVNKTITFFAYEEAAGINKNTSDNKKASNIYDSKLDKTRKEVKVGIDNAYAQYLVSNYEDDWDERQIQADSISSVTLKIIQARFSLEFDGQSLLFLENERIVGEWNASSTNKLEKNNTVKVTYDSNKLNLKGIDCKFKDELCYLFRSFNIIENIVIPLNVNYQKRILILIERFKETTEATLARMNIYIDGKRVKQDGSIENEKGIKSIDDETFPYAYILDRPGPDCIKSGINLRIPDGRYEAQWHNYGIRINTIQIHNRFVSLGRSILIHDGNTPKDSEGCMLINDYFMDNMDNIIFQNQQESKTKEQRLAKSLKKDFTKEILGTSIKDISGFVKEYVEVRIRNKFNPTQRTTKDIVKIYNKNGTHLFSLERNNIEKYELKVRELYEIKGIQWFETSADNYHKLLYVNEKLKDKQECQSLGVLYFTWKEVVEFARENNGDLHWHDILFMTALSDKLNYIRKMPYDWKNAKNGADDYILVSMEGIPYWADAVGQIPFAIDTYKMFYRQYGDKQKARNGVIKLGNVFADGSIFNPDYSNSYDNAMILRGINWAQKRYYKPTMGDCFNEVSIKNCGYKTLKITNHSIDELAKDSSGKNII